LDFFDNRIDIFTVPA